MVIQKSDEMEECIIQLRRMGGDLFTVKFPKSEKNVSTVEVIIKTRNDKFKVFFVSCSAV